MSTVFKSKPNKEVVISSGVETVTPAMAQTILSKNTNNRNMKPTVVKYYQHLIEHDKWDLNGESIKIASDGTLLDGQHRLEAISRSGKAIKTFVVRGLPRETFTTIDAGKTRNHGDYLKIAGVEGNQSLLAAAARVSKYFQKNGNVISSNSKTKISPQDIVYFVEKHPGLTESMNKLQQRTGMLLPSSIAIGCHYVFSIINAEKADIFFETLISGENLVLGNPVLALRNRLLSHRGDGRGGEGHRRMLLYCVVHAFNAFLEGKEMKQIPYRNEFDIFLNRFEESVLPTWND